MADKAGRKADDRAEGQKASSFQRLIEIGIAQKLGHDLFGYFEAQFLQDIWWIGERIPTGDRSW